MFEKFFGQRLGKKIGEKNICVVTFISNNNKETKQYTYEPGKELNKIEEIIDEVEMPEQIYSFTFKTVITKGYHSEIFESDEDIRNFYVGERISLTNYQNNFKDLDKKMIAELADDEYLIGAVRHKESGILTKLYPKDVVITEEMINKKGAITR